MEQSKALLQSRTFWIAVGQAVIGAIGIFSNSYPGAGWLLILKSSLDVVVRLYTETSITSITPPNGIVQSLILVGTIANPKRCGQRVFTPSNIGVSLEVSFRYRPLLSAIGATSAGNAQALDNPEIAACKATGVLALKQKSPAVQTLVLDMETMVVSKANTEIEGIPVRTIIMGDAYLEKKGTEKAQHFLCIIGDKGKVLLTFFAAPS
jgi:hypothetical protein